MKNLQKSCKNKWHFTVSSTELHNKNLPITYSLVLIQVKIFQHLLGCGENENALSA